MSRTAFLSSMNASSEALNMSMVWGDPDTAPYSVYQHITYLWEEPHQDGKCMVFPRSTDCVMSFNCIRKPHFVASHKSHDFVGFHLDQAQPARRRRQWHPTQVLLPGKSHGRRSLVGCSPWGPQSPTPLKRLSSSSSSSQPALLLLAGLMWSSTNQLMTLLQGSAGRQIRAVGEAGWGGSLHPPGVPCIRIPDAPWQSPVDKQS